MSITIIDIECLYIVRIIVSLSGTFRRRDELDMLCFGSGRYKFNEEQHVMHFGSFIYNCAFPPRTMSGQIRAWLYYRGVLRNPFMINGCGVVMRSALSEFIDNVNTNEHSPELIM